VEKVFACLDLSNANNIEPSQTLMLGRCANRFLKGLLNGRIRLRAGGMVIAFHKYDALHLRMN